MQQKKKSMLIFFIPSCMDISIRSAVTIRLLGGMTNTRATLKGRASCARDSSHFRPHFRKHRNHV